MEIDPRRRRQISFVRVDTLRGLLAFKPKVLNDECDLSDYPVDILSFDIIFFESDIAHGFIFRGRIVSI